MVWCRKFKLDGQIARRYLDDFGRQGMRLQEQRNQILEPQRHCRRSCTRMERRRLLQDSSAYGQFSEQDESSLVVLQPVLYASHAI